jgi:hypothetical protein
MSCFPHRLFVSRQTLLAVACSVCLGCIFAFVSTAHADENLQVDEAASRATLERAPVISLRILNPSRVRFAARIKLELLDTQDRVRASATKDATLDAKANDVEIRLPAPDLRADEQDALPWFRLRYSVEPVAPLPPQAATTVNGIISLARIAPDIFNLQVTARNTTREAARYTVRARTINPVTARPVAGVRVTAKVEFDDDDNHTPLVAPATITDDDGYALLTFNLPARVAETFADVSVTAERNDFTQEASERFQIYNFTSILVSTDKPIYQPGQALRIRALALDARRRPLTHIPLTLKIEDGESTMLFRIDLETSRFGVAHAAWQIPDNAKLGDYRISIEITDGAYAENSGTIETVKVSRYELPNFAVKVAPEKPYYLPTDASAKVEVTADYLFGQTVKRGRVRVVREQEREWDYREQRWDVKEAAEYAGDVNADGKFTAHIALATNTPNLLKTITRAFATSHLPRTSPT